MSVIKWKKAVNDWVSVYRDAIKRRLKKDKNLSDLDDKAAARENLEIVGDNVTSHQHDSIYVPMIDAEAEERKAKDEEILAELETLKAQEDSSLKDLIQSLVNSETAANQKISNLNNQISSTQSRLNTNVSKASSQADIGAKTIYVSGSSISNSSATVEYNSAYSNKSYNTNSGVGSGTYTLRDLINALVNVSHTHHTTTSSVQCNCDCDCVCRG